MNVPGAFGLFDSLAPKLLLGFLHVGINDGAQDQPRSVDWVLSIYLQREKLHRKFLQSGIPHLDSDKKNLVNRTFGLEHFEHRTDSESKFRRFYRLIEK